MIEGLNIVPSQDPKGLYLHGLGTAIANLTPKVADAHWFNSKDQFDKRMEMIESIHKKAMEVINTIQK